MACWVWGTLVRVHHAFSQVCFPTCVFLTLFLFHCPAEASPEEFFVPTVWGLVVAQAGIPFTLSAISLFTPAGEWHALQAIATRAATFCLATTTVPSTCLTTLQWCRCLKTPPQHSLHKKRERPQASR